eukprot:5874444-Pleurochrysis_carterae.AAC.1
MAPSQAPDSRTRSGSASASTPATAQPPFRASVPARFDFIHAATVASFRADSESPLSALAELKRLLGNTSSPAVLNQTPPDLVW